MLFGSLAGVLALAGAAWALGLGGASLADDADARDTAEALIPGFEAVSVDLTPGHDAAIVTGADGAKVRLTRLGAHFIAEPVA